MITKGTSQAFVSPEVLAAGLHRIEELVQDAAQPIEYRVSADREVIFRETKLKGAYLIELEKREDERGFFARSFCSEEFARYGLNPNVVQCNVSFNRNKDTLRGLHFQIAPYEEAKLVRCTKGSLYDVCIDLRPSSPTFKQHVGVVLSASEHNMLYIPEGFAHGFQTLEDNTEVFYQMSQVYLPEAARGVRWDDPAFAIEWPAAAERTISNKDRSYAAFDEREFAHPALVAQGTAGGQ